jgi:hypothetical protein
MTYASITSAQIVDYLYKKVGYGVAKTDVSSRAAANEGNASPFLTLGTALYQLDYAIPRYTSFGAMITGGNIVTTANPTTGLPGGLTISNVVTVQASTIVGSLTGATWQTNLYNWIPVPVGGQGYQVGVFAGPAGLDVSGLQGSSANPNGPPRTVAVTNSGTNSDSWYFDYQAGILNFPDVNVPTTVSNVSNVVYIVGAVYSGYTGITNWANLSVTGNINSVSGNINLTNGNVYAQNYYGTFQGTIGGGTSINLANVATYETITPVSTSPNTFYPELSNISVAGNSITGVSTNLSFVPSTGTLTATAFSGAGSALTSLTATNIVGTVATANVALYEQITNLTNNQTYYLPFANVASGNSTLGAVTGVNVNPSTGQINSVAANVTTLNVGSTSVLAGQVQITNSTPATTYASGALVVSGGLGVAGAAFFNSNVSIAGNLTVTGNSVSIGASTLSITDPIINLNTPQDLTPLTVPTTSDIGLKFHYYDTADSAGFAGRTVVDGYFTYWTKGTDTANVFTGTTLGTFKGGGTILANARVVGGGLSANTGSMQVWGDASITGNLYVGNGLQNTPIGTLGSSTGNFTTVTAQTINAATIGNSGATLVGTLSSTNIAGTVATANVALYEQITNLTNNQTYYLPFANITSGNSTLGAVSTVSINPFSGNLSAPYFVGNAAYLTGLPPTTASGVYQSANVAYYEQVTPLTTNQVFYPMFSNLVTAGNTTAGVATNLSFNPSTGTLTATNFNGTVQGTVATANATIYTGVTNTASGTYYPVLSAQSVTGNAQAAVNSTLTYNAATGALTATSFSGTVTATNVVGTVATANVSLYDSVTAYTTNQTFYPQFSNISTTGNSLTGVATNLTFNPSTGTLSATALSGTLSAVNVAGTVATANIALYEQVQNYTTGTFYPTFSNTNTSSGNTTVGVNSSLTYNAGTGTLTATTFSGAFSGAITGTATTANATIYTGVTNTSTGTYYPMLSAQSTTGNAQAAVNGSLSYNAATGNLTATTFTGAGVFSTVSTTGVASLGANVVITNGSNTNNVTSGALVIAAPGGIGVGGNVNIGTQMFVGSGAQATVLTSPIAVKRGTSTSGPGVQFTQDALINATNTGSSDFIAYGNNYPGPANDHGWMDMGFTGDAFNDPAYSITKSNDGYLFSSGANATVGGNLVLSTDWTGSYNDIVLGVGSFYANSEVARFHGNATNSGTFIVKLPTNVAPAANTGAFQVWGGASFGANLYTGGAAIFNGSQTAGNEFIVRGRNDATLFWARPATYDTVIIGNSATAGTAVPGAKLLINTSDSIMLPVGTNSQRPSAAGLGTDTAGMLRYNSTANSIEWYTGSSWQSGTASFTVIADQQFTPSGVTNTFTLSTAATTASVIVSINGVVQIPTLAYSVSGTTLTFTEVPLATDIIDVRTLTTTSTVTNLSSIAGKVQVLVDDSAGVIFSSGTSGNVLVFTMPPGGGLVSQDANVSVASAATPTTIDTVSNSLYRSAKYIVQVTNGTSYQAMEAMVIQNGTTATIAQYANVTTGSNLGILSATVSGGNTLLQFTAVNATNTVRLTRQYMLI